MFPNHNQWKKWSLPSKLGVVSAYISIFGLLGSIPYFFKPDSVEPKPTEIHINNSTNNSNNSVVEGDVNIFNPPQIVREMDSLLVQSEPKLDTKIEGQFINEIRTKLIQNKIRIPRHRVREAERLIDERRIKEANILVDREISKAEKREQVINECADYNNTDTDGDGISDVDECNAGLNPLFRDSDGDGYDDDIEITYRSDPKDKYSYPRMSIAKIDASNSPSLQVNNPSRIDSEDQFSERNQPTSERPSVASSSQGESDSGGGSLDFRVILLLFCIYFIRFYIRVSPNNCVEPDIPPRR